MAIVFSPLGLILCPLACECLWQTLKTLLQKELILLQMALLLNQNEQRNLSQEDFSLE